MIVLQFGPVQQACVHGQDGVLDFLLTKGFPLLPPGAQHWHEEAPIYLACRQGHSHIVDRIMMTDNS